MPSPLENFHQLTLAEEYLTEEMKMKIISQMLESDKTDRPAAKSPQQSNPFHEFSQMDPFANGFHT